ncbi:MAG: lactonase family protein [Ginsengibacter sp.]
MTKTMAVLKIPLILSFLFLYMTTSAQQYYLIIGTYSNTGSKGIYVYSFNAKSGKVKWVSNTDSSTNPSFVIISHNQKYLYAVNETHGSDPGRVSAYSFDKKNGKLHFINTTLSGGDAPCHLATSKDDKWLTVANYSSGTTTVFPLNDDGSLRPYSQLIDDSIYRAAGDNATPHVHETVFSPDEKYLFTPDLGLDKLMIYEFHPQSEQPLVLSSPPYVESPKGSGPRHITFHPNKKFAYLMHEMGGIVTAYHYNDGKFRQIQELPTFPPEFVGKKDGAEIQVSPDGKFLYVSNRGDLNSITIFSIDPTDGKLTLKGYQSTLGKGPRNFIIDPAGNFLLVAHQYTNDVIIFKRNKTSGLLTQTQNEIHLPIPICLQLIAK